MEDEKPKKEKPRVRPFRPAIPKASAISKLTTEKFGERVTEKETVSLDLLKPQSSAWLQDIHNQLSSEDAETRFIALWRFKAVYNRMVVVRGPATCAEVTTYVLQQGLVLKEILRLLRAAQVHGDVYFFPNPGNSPKMFNIFSKTELCFGLLHTLMMDSRAVRHVRKAIPDLIDIQEGSFSADAIFDPDSGEALDASSQPGNKKAVLLSMLTLASFSKQARVELGKRTGFLRQVLIECILAHGSENLSDMAILLVLHVRYACPLSELALEIVRLAMRVLDLSKRKDVIEAAVQVLKGVIHDEGEALKIQARNACDFCPLVALAISSAVSNELTAQAVVFLCFFDETIRRSFGPSMEAILLNSLSRQQHVCSESQADRHARVFKRKQQFEEIFQARGPSEDTRTFVGVRGENNKDASIDKRDSSFEMEPEHPMDRPPNRTVVTAVNEPDLNPRRKCSRANCSNVESKAREFKLCSGCRLAVYCSQDCQKRAWKEGHRKQCTESQPKDKKGT